MNFKHSFFVITVCAIVVAFFQNCEKSENLANPEVTYVLREGSSASVDLEIESTHKIDESLTVYDLDKSINVLYTIRKNKMSELHFLGKPYALLSEEVLARDEKGEIIYFRCRDNEVDNCVNELLESAALFCKQIGSSQYFIEESASSPTDGSYSFSSVVGPDDPFFTIRLKSGDLVKTPFKYLMCLNIDENLYRSKIQPIE